MAQVQLGGFLGKGSLNIAQGVSFYQNLMGAPALGWRMEGARIGGQGSGQGLDQGVSKPMRAQIGGTEASSCHWCNTS